MTNVYAKKALVKRPEVALTLFGFGAAQLGNLYRETTDAEAQGAIAAAWDAGVRYFDTAPHYGLGLDYIDIAYLHDPDEHWDLASTEGMRGLIEMRTLGLLDPALVTPYRGCVKGHAAWGAAGPGQGITRGRPRLSPREFLP